MSIDRQRISAVKKLEQLGYSFDGSDWQQPTSGAAARARQATSYTPL
jgi:hypothetical protein